MTAGEHHCEYRERVVELQRHIFGQCAERMPSAAGELRQERSRKGSPLDVTHTLAGAA